MAQETKVEKQTRLEQEGIQARKEQTIKNDFSKNGEIYNEESDTLIPVIQKYNDNICSKIKEIIGDKAQYDKDVALFESLILKCENREIIVNPKYQEDFIEPENFDNMHIFFGLLAPGLYDICTNLFPMFGYAYCHQKRNGALELGYLYRSVYNPVGLGYGFRCI